MKVTDQQIARALIDQVRKAANGHSEMDVTTLISRPMWYAFNRFTGHPEDTEPTEWQGLKDTHRVFGSRTVVVDRDDMWSISSLNLVD